MSYTTMGKPRGACELWAQPSITTVLGLLPLPLLPLTNHTWGEATRGWQVTGTLLWWVRVGTSSPRPHPGTLARLGSFSFG